MAIPNLWRTKEQRYRLQGDICPACSTTVFPPKRVCPHCHYGAVVSAATFEQNGYEQTSDSYMMVFQMPQVAELSIAGDD